MEEEAEDKDDSKRKTRNLSEKKRRDQFNMLVNELGSMVSTNNNRKMDKSTVLRSTISFLKNHNEITLRSRDNAVQEDWKPAFLTNEEFTYLVLEALECFIMVFSASGYIYYVSESVTSLLGHNPNDILNKSIFDLAYEEDRPNILEILSNPTASASGINSDNEVTFQCHVQRGALDIQDAITYELVQFNGCFRTNAELSESCDLSFEQDHEPRVLFVCTGKLCTPQLIRDVSLVDPSRNEFTSRHSLEWKFLFLDHRAPPIIGYLPFEVLGTSGYDYYHFDDLEKVVTCHEALMQKGEMMSCYYRFLTKGQQWIWLQTRFYITYHQWNSKPEFVVCNHRVVSYSDVDDNPKQEVTEQDERSDVEAGPSGLHEPSPDRLAAVSPSYMSDNSEAFGNSYHSVSQPPSLKSTATSAGSTSAAATGGTATTAAASWATRPSHIHYAAGSDTGSVSGDSRSSQWNSSQQSLRMPELVPQHGIGAQYLEPVPYVSAMGVPGVLPLPLQALPVIVTPDQAQLQEQLQRTHRELQELIVRQQEELRQVKEQLLLARLGILQPIINVQDPYAQTAELQQGARLPAQLVYEGGQQRAMAGYPLSPHSPLHQPHQPHQPPSRQPLQPHQPPSRQPHQPPSHQPHQPPSHQPHQPPSHQPHQPPSHQPHQPPSHQPHQPPSRQPHQPPSHQPHQPPSHQPHQPPSRQPHQPPSHQPHQPPSRQPHQPHEPPPPDHPAHYSQDQLHPNMPQ